MIFKAFIKFQKKTYSIFENLVLPKKIGYNRAFMKLNSWFFYEMNRLKKIVFGKWPRIEILERFLSEEKGVG